MWFYEKKIKLLKELMLSITSEERESGRMKKTNTGKFKQGIWEVEFTGVHFSIVLW